MSTFDDPKAGEVWEDTKHGADASARQFRVLERAGDTLRVEWLTTYRNKEVRSRGGVSKNAFRDPERFRIVRRPQ